MADLFPAAQAVLDAAKDAYWSTEEMCPNDAEVIAAAALRAATDQVVPDDGPRPDMVYAGTRWEERQRIRAALLAIAAELHG